MNDPAHDAQCIVDKAVSRFDCVHHGLATAYLAEVLKWNQSVGLVSRKDPIAACERLLLESLELAQLLGLGDGRVADIGSGAGFPGVIWALSFPGVDVTMIERREKRALFLERACRLLPLANATAVALDVRDAHRFPDFHRTFDIAVTMAVGDPSVLASSVESMLVANGRFASTIAGAVQSPHSIGAKLFLERRVDGEFGRYTIYRRGV